MLKFARHPRSERRRHRHQGLLDDGRCRRGPLATAGARGHLLQKRLFDNGLHVKTTGDSAILAPPYIATTDYIDQMIEMLRTTLERM
jgi:adenosylmethionine-8-amino-7-oxononanoate aminotransferase